MSLEWAQTPPDPCTRACREAGAAANGLGMLAVTQAAGAGCRQSRAAAWVLCIPSPLHIRRHPREVWCWWGKAEQSVVLGGSLSSSMCALGLLGAWE